jgi:hypothetical protein
MGCRSARVDSHFWNMLGNNRIQAFLLLHSNGTQDYIREKIHKGICCATVIWDHVNARLAKDASVVE